MKKVIMFITLTFALLIGVNQLYADEVCDSLKDEADAITVEEKDFTDEDGAKIRIIVNGMTANTYITYIDDFNNESITYFYADSEDGMISIPTPNIYRNNKIVINTYITDNCYNESVKTFNITTERFNEYSKYIVCEENPKLKVCNPFYDTSKLNEEEFLNKAEEERQFIKDNSILGIAKRYGIYFIAPIILIGGYYIIKINKVKRGKNEE